MAEYVEPILQSILALPAALIWLSLMGAAAIEYVFPPFPGDAVVLAGGVLATHGGLDIVPIFAFITAGSLLGAGLDYEVGCWLSGPRDTFLHRWIRRPGVSRTVERIRRGFTRHGDLYLVINRFLPGVRALFFVAAGLSSFPRRRTLLMAFIAAMLWNGLILGVGAVIGANLDELLRFAEGYAQVAWAVVVGAIVIVVIRGRIRAKRGLGGSRDL